MNIFPNEIGEPFYGVLFSTAEPDLPPDKIRIKGFFRPRGFCGPFELRYSYDIPEENRASLDATLRKIEKIKGKNTFESSNAYFEALKPNSN